MKTTAHRSPTDPQQGQPLWDAAQEVIVEIAQDRPVFAHGPDNWEDVRLERQTTTNDFLDQDRTIVMSTSEVTISGLSPMCVEFRDVAERLLAERGFMNVRVILALARLQ